MASGSGQYPAGRAPAAGVVFAPTFFFESPAMAPARPVVPAHFFVPQGPPPAFRAPAPQPQMPMAPARFVGRPGLPPRPPRTPPPRPVAGVGDRIEMAPLEPNHAFWAPYRSGSSRPVELDFLGLFGGPARPAAVPDPDDNTSGTSSPSFKDWIQEEDGSSEDMQTESYMD